MDRRCRSCSELQLLGGPRASTSDPLRQQDLASSEEESAGAGLGFSQGLVGLSRLPWRCAVKRRASNLRYSRSEKARERAKSWEQTPKARATRERYAASHIRVGAGGLRFTYALPHERTKDEVREQLADYRAGQRGEYEKFSEALNQVELDGEANAPTPAMGDAVKRLNSRVYKPQSVLTPRTAPARTRRRRRARGR